jgi:hypothetical protein
MTITTIQQSIEVSNVGLATISDIVEDEENAVWIREIRVYGELDSGQAARTLLFTLRLSADAKAYVELQAPTQTF